MDLIGDETMTTREADRIIKKGEPVTVHNAHFRETFTARFVRRDRFHIYSENGGVYERADLAIVGSQERSIP